MQSTQNDSGALIPRFIMAGIVAFGAVSAFFVLRQPAEPLERSPIAAVKSAQALPTPAPLSASAVAVSAQASTPRPAEAAPAGVPSQPKPVAARTVPVKPAAQLDSARDNKAVAVRPASAAPSTSASADFTPRVRVVDTLPARAASAAPSPAPRPAAPAAPSSGFKPVVVAVTADKVWVKVDQTRTVIVNKDEGFQSMGKYQGPDASGGAKFENGVLPSAF